MRYVKGLKVGDTLPVNVSRFIVPSTLDMRGGGGLGAVMFGLDPFMAISDNNRTNNKIAFLANFSQSVTFGKCKIIRTMQGLSLF